MRGVLREDHFFLGCHVIEQFRLHLSPRFAENASIVLMPVYGAHVRVDVGWHTRARTLLERVGLAERISFRASKLSGGQKQRVAVARALVMKPELVLADEPTGNLDRSSSDEVMRLLRELSREDGTAFLISTHDESIAQRCDRILSMQDRILVGSTPRAAVPAVPLQVTEASG